MKIAVKLLVFAVIMLVYGYKNSCRTFTNAALVNCENKSCFELVARCGYDTKKGCHQFYKNECVMKNHICNPKNKLRFHEVGAIRCTMSEKHCGPPIEEYEYFN